MVKTIDNYIDRVQQQFPFLCKDDIQTILDFGCRRYLQANKLHADVALKNNVEDNMLAHCGRLGFSALKNWFRWHVKWRMKERVLYKFRGETWDGYYYIGLDDESHQKILRQKKTKTFTRTYLVKIKNEWTHEKWVTHIWRIPYPLDCGWKFWVDKVSSNEAEYVGETHYEDHHQCFLGRYKDGPSSAKRESTADDGCSECNDNNI